MGRKPTKYLNLPKGMRARPKPRGIYYYYDTGGKPRKEIPLGNDYAEAVRKWAELEKNNLSVGSGILTFKDVCDRYVREIVPTKAALTQRDNLKELGWLLKFFNDPPVPLEAIKPLHVRQYLSWRGKIRANREKALLSHIWNMSREWGYTSLSNPCTGVNGMPETGRDIYVEDDVFAAVLNVADQPLKDAMNLAYLTGQRPADTLKLNMASVRDGALEFAQEKTKKKMRMLIVGELEVLIAEIKVRKETLKIHSAALVCDESGKALSKGQLRSRFDKARRKAAQEYIDLADDIREFQFRDLRSKAASDKSDSGGIREAQMQLGHKNISMTEHYVRKRKGQKVTPTK